MMKSFLQATALCLVATSLSSCALAQMPVRMLQAMGRTVGMVTENAPPSRPVRLEQRELLEHRPPSPVTPAAPQSAAQMAEATPAALTASDSPS